MTSSGKTDVHLQIAHTAFPAPSFGDGNRSHVIAALGRLGRLFHFALRGGEISRTMPFANSALNCLFGASLVAAVIFIYVRAMPVTNSWRIPCSCSVSYIPSRHASSKVLPV